MKTYIDETMGIARVSSKEVSLFFMRNKTYSIKITNKFRALWQAFSKNIHLTRVDVKAMLLCVNRPVTFTSIGCPSLKV